MDGLTVKRVSTSTQIPLFQPPQEWKPPAELPRLPRQGRLAFDVETRDDHLTDLGPGVRRGAYIAGFSVAWDDQKFYLPIRHQGGGNLDPDMVLRWARAELSPFAGELVGANLLYDLDFAAHEDITFKHVKRFRDVQIAEPLLDENLLHYNLDSIANRHLGERKDEADLRAAAADWGFGSTQKAIKANLWRLPAWHVGKYGESDADLPLRILPIQEAKLEAEGLADIWDIECRQIPLLLAMRRRGVRVDLDRAAEVRADLVRQREGWLRAIRRIAGPRAELKAPRSLAEGLRGRGLNLQYTASGEVSITKAWLEANQGDELCAAILEGRKVDTLITTFLDGHVFTHSIKGRIHCVFNQLKGDDGGTIARYSSENPNLQNIPTRTPEGKLIRSIFVPEEGEDWGRHDLSQIEYRLLVHYAVGRGSNEARESYTTNPKTDFHKMACVFLGGDPEDKDLRKKIKATNFCKVYGGGIEKIAETFGCSIEEAKLFVDKYESEFPFVKETSDKASKRARTAGQIRTLGGRIQRFPFWEPIGNSKKPKQYRAAPKLREAAELEWGANNLVRAWTYTGLSRLLQSSAADVMKKAMAEVWESGVCAVIGAPLVTVHDELGESIPRTQAGAEAAAEIKHLMETPYKLRVPMIAEFGQGANWNEAA